MPLDAQIIYDGLNIINFGSTERNECVGTAINRGELNGNLDKLEVILINLCNGDDGRLGC
jgi:hypothetical protein